MTDKTFDPEKYIEDSTKLMNNLKTYFENNEPSSELVDAMKELYSELLTFSDVLDESSEKNNFEEL